MLSETQLLVLQVVLNAGGDIAFSLACGALLTLLWKGLPSLPPHRFFSVVAASAFLMTLLQPLRLALLIVTMTGGIRFPDLVSQGRDVLNTHAGSVLAYEFVASSALACFAFLPLPRNLRISAGSAAWLALSVSRAISGHAASDGNFSLRELSQWVHLVSTAVWSGGVMMASLVLVRLEDRLCQVAYLKRLSLQSALAVVFIALSGAWNTWLGTTGQMATLLHSQWGLVLDAKLLLVLSALSLGARNRQMLQKPERADALKVIHATLRAEAVIMVAILTLSAWLASTSPPF